MREYDLKDPFVWYIHDKYEIFFLHTLSLW